METGVEERMSWRGNGYDASQVCGVMEILALGSVARVKESGNSDD